MAWCKRSPGWYFIIFFFLILLCGVPYFFCWQSLVNPSFSFIPDKLLPRCLPTSACFAQDALDCPLWTLADSKLIELGWHGMWVLLSTRKVLLKLSGVKRTSQIAKSFVMFCWCMFFSPSTTGKVVHLRIWATKLKIKSHLVLHWWWLGHTILFVLCYACSIHTN